MAKVGRKNKIDVIKNNLDKIEKWLVNKNSDEFISNCLGIGYSTWLKYKSTLPEIIEIIEKTPQKRANLIEDLREAEIKRALGYDYEETKTIIVTDEKTGQPKILRKEIYKKHCAADPVANERARYRLGDKETLTADNFELKKQLFEFKREQAKADEWCVPDIEEGEDN